MLKFPNRARTALLAIATVLGFAMAGSNSIANANNASEPGFSPRAIVGCDPVGNIRSLGPPMGYIVFQPGAKCASKYFHVRITAHYLAGGAYMGTVTAHCPARGFTGSGSNNWCTAESRSVTNRDGFQNYELKIEIAWGERAGNLPNKENLRTAATY